MPDEGLEENDTPNYTENKKTRTEKKNEPPQKRREKKMTKHTAPTRWQL